MFKKCVVLICLVLFASCSFVQSGPHETKEKKLKVLSTTQIVGDVVSRVGKERITHQSLITGDIDPHSYELVKGDDEKLHDADLIFSNGLGLEHGASLQYQLKHHAANISLGDYLLETDPSAILRVDGQIDPHVWMDVSLWSKTVDLVVEKLTEKDPEGKTIYMENGAQVKLEMEELDRKVQALLFKVPSEKRYLVTSHDAFNYFAKRYLSDPSDKSDQGRFMAPEGLAPDGQLSTSDIKKVADHLLQFQIQTVFPESNVSRDALKKIVKVCQEKGLVVTLSGKALYGDVLGPKGSDAETYSQMIEHNVAVLVKTWEGNNGK